MDKIDDKLIRGLAELFIKEPSSLEILLMLSDEGPKTIEQISREIIYDTKTTDLLDKLKQFQMVDIKNGLVDIIDHGRYLVANLIAKMRKNKKENLELEEIIEKL